MNAYRDRMERQVIAEGLRCLCAVMSLAPSAYGIGMTTRKGREPGMSDATHPEERSPRGLLQAIAEWLRSVIRIV